MTMLAISGMALAVLGAIALYAASPNQLLLAVPPKQPRPWARPLGLAGLAILAGSLALLLQWAGPATAVFIVLTLAMLVFSIVPPVAAWARGDRKAAR